MTGETPLVDRVLTDSLAIPPGVDQWLREVERSARELYRQFSAAEPGAAQTARFADVRQQLEEFLHDEQKSPFRRLLRRPLSQIGPGSPAVRSFDAYSSRLFQQAQEALEAQSGAETVIEQLANLRSRHSPRMPFHTALTLERHGIGSSMIGRIRSPTDVRGMLRRLAHADSRLAHLAAHLPPTPDEDRVVSCGENRSINTAELWAALQLRLRQRDASPGRTERAGALRWVQARQVEQLAAAAGRHQPGDRAEHLLAEYLAGESIRLGSAAAGSGTDLELWAALIQAADQGRFAPTDSPTWQPRVSAVREADVPPDDDRTTLYVIPIGEDFVYIANEYPSPVRLWSRIAREGELVEARVFGGSDTPVSTDLLATDIQPLFDGAEGGDAAWYATESRASLTVLAAYGTGWFGVLRSRGAVRRMATPSYRESGRNTPALRVFDVPGSGARRTLLKVGPTGIEPGRFLGIESHEVATAILDHRIAWLRVADQESSRGALAREHALIRAVRRRAPHLVATPLGRAELAPEGPAGFLYAPPLALNPSDSPLVRDWLRGSPRAAMAAILRTMLRVHEAGYAMGVYHLDLFAFGMELGAGSQTHLQPRADVIAAPCAARLGQAFEPPGRHLQLRPPVFARLGFAGLPPPVQGGEVALPDSDAVALALMFLDFALVRPIRTRPGESTTWNDLLARVRKYRTYFSDPAWAEEMAAALSPQGDRKLLISLLGRVGQS
jgi:hypothetical protein